MRVRESGVTFQVHSSHVFIDPWDKSLMDSVSSPEGQGIGIGLLRPLALCLCLCLRLFKC